MKKNHPLKIILQIIVSLFLSYLAVAWRWQTDDERPSIYVKQGPWRDGRNSLIYSRIQISKYIVYIFLNSGKKNVKGINILLICLYNIKKKKLHVTFSFFFLHNLEYNMWMPSYCVPVIKIVTRYNGATGIGNKSQEGHDNRSSCHLCELIFAPVRLPVINPSGRWRGCWYQKIC